MKVLIVDDSLLAEHALKSYFEKLGHTVVALAKNGEMGKKLFLEHEPDLVTVDAVMPGMSGADFIVYLNELEKKQGKRTHILMISSEEVPQEDKSRIRVDGYLLKPITLDKIKKAISNF